MLMAYYDPRSGFARAGVFVFHRFRVYAVSSEA